MLFVNSIANIVHLHCTSTNGHPNKNVGDAFLLVWKKHGADEVEGEEEESNTDKGMEDDDKMVKKSQGNEEKLGGKGTDTEKSEGDTKRSAEGAEAETEPAATKTSKDNKKQCNHWKDIAAGAMKCIMRIISEMKSLNAAVANEKLAGHDTRDKVW